MKEKLFLILVMLMALVGCGSSNVNTPSQANTPSQVVQKFFSHLEKNETSKAQELLSQRLTIGLSGLQVLAGAQTTLIMVSQVKNSPIHKGDDRPTVDIVSHGIQTHIKDVAITKEDIKGESAIVDFRVSYTEGFNLNFQDILIMEGGRWKIDQFSRPSLVPATGG